MNNLPLGKIEHRVFSLQVPDTMAYLQLGEPVKISIIDAINSMDEYWLQLFGPGSENLYCPWLDDLMDQVPALHPPQIEIVCVSWDLTMTLNEKRELRFTFVSPQGYKLESEQ